MLLLPANWSLCTLLQLACQDASMASWAISRRPCQHSSSKLEASEQPSLTGVAWWPDYPPSSAVAPTSEAESCISRPA